MVIFIYTTTRRCGNRYHNDSDFIHDDDDDSENDYRKKIGKKIPDQNRGQKFNFFSREFETKRG